MKRTQVAIIGAGPAGLVLSRLLQIRNIDSVVIERHSQAHVEARVRAGVLEPESADVLKECGLGEAVRREGLVHDGVNLSANGDTLRIDLRTLAGKSLIVYGQTEIVRGLIAQSVLHPVPILFEVEDVALHDAETTPSLTFSRHGESCRIDCDFIACCDGQHGVSAEFVAQSGGSVVEQTWPFVWLGILADCPPCHHELIYARHARGFALASMRSRVRSRYYVQVPAGERIEDWPDDRIWDEIALRLGPNVAAHLTRAPSLEKSTAFLRSRVVEPMHRGKLFLVGDAGHIVPPTGAKGLNLAVADAELLASAFAAYYRGEDASSLETYSAAALSRARTAQRFSWWLTRLTHKLPEAESSEERLRDEDFKSLLHSKSAQRQFAQSYIGITSQIAL